VLRVDFDYIIFDFPLRLSPAALFYIVGGSREVTRFFDILLTADGVWNMVLGFP